MEKKGGKKRQVAFVANSKDWAQNNRERREKEGGFRSTDKIKKWENSTAQPPWKTQEQ